MAEFDKEVSMQPDTPSGATPEIDDPHAKAVTIASADGQAADLLAAEERSEDDGMREHVDKASDPVRWAARRDALHRAQ